MSHVLAYCAFQHGPHISVPASGVKTSPVQTAQFSALRLLWSEVDWPFNPADMQKNAVEFHGVVHHVFNQTAVIPFRLLSVFEDEAALNAFAAGQQERFLEDLERLKNFVQMEFVVFPSTGRQQQDSSTGRAYLEQKAALLRTIEQHVQQVRDALGEMSHQFLVREGKNGHRYFVLVERGREHAFREAVKGIAAPEAISLRASGPWPAAEFLSEMVKAPQVAGAK